MSEDVALALLQLLAQEDGQSIHRVAKRLGLPLPILLVLALGAFIGGLVLFWIWGRGGVRRG